MKQYKIKLNSGRILGPIDLDRIAILIKKKHVLGDEQVKATTENEWRAIYEYPEIVKLFQNNEQSYHPIEGTPIDPNKTTVLPFPKQNLPPKQDKPAEEQGDNSDNNQDDKTQFVSEEDLGTIVDLHPELNYPLSTSQDENHSLENFNNDKYSKKDTEDNDGFAQIDPVEPTRVTPLTNEETKIYTRRELKEHGVSPAKAKEKKTGRAKTIRNFLVTSVALLALYEVFFEDTDDKIKIQKHSVIKPKLVELVEPSKRDASKSEKFYKEAIKLYIADNVLAYEGAANKFSQAISYDEKNIKAQAMLASCYINLIDASNKDENYFSVVTQLIDLSRSSQTDLVETVIADVEFYLMINRPEAAAQKISSYTKERPQFDAILFYYIGLVSYQKGDYPAAAKYLANFPDNQAFSPKIFYLRALIADKLGDTNSAKEELKKALKLDPSHPKSLLKTVELLSLEGKLKSASGYIDALLKEPLKQTPQELALSHYYLGKLSLAKEDYETAEAAFVRATKLDPSNHDYLLEYYTLQAKNSELKNKQVKQAQMYVILSEAEALLKQGKTHEALTLYLKARETHMDSTLPLIKMGDLLTSQQDFYRAKQLYETAAKKAPQDINIWTKYINALIESYEWAEAEKAMDKFRNLPVSQSAIDKAAGDLYSKMNRYEDAQVFYKKAMTRESIDSGVYISYAKNLIALKRFKEAVMFFSLAQRFDPLNTEATLGIAVCTAEMESIEAAITYLQSEIERQPQSKAKLLTKIADFYTQKGSWDEAQRYVDQAKLIDPNEAGPWKIQAKIYLNQENTNKKALTLAQEAYLSYSDRNNSDPVGYLERYRIFAKQSKFEEAQMELDKIQQIYPKYPNLHYYRGILYQIMGNYQKSIEELNTELKENPTAVRTLTALGKSLNTVGNNAEALGYLKKAMQIDPRSVEAKVQASTSNQRLKNYTGALALLQAAIALDKGNPNLYRQLGFLYREMGDPQNARNAFKKYLEMEPDASDKAEIQRYI